MSIKNNSYFIHYYQDGPPPAIDKSGYYTGSVTSGVVNPAFSNKSMYKKKQNLDNISDTSLFEEDDMDDEFYLWDKNQDSGLVSAVSKSDNLLLLYLSKGVKFSHSLVAKGTVGAQHMKGRAHSSPFASLFL